MIRVDRFLCEENILNLEGDVGMFCHILKYEQMDFRNHIQLFKCAKCIDLPLYFESKLQINCKHLD